AAIQGIAECLTRRCTSRTCRPVLRSYQKRLSSSVALPSWTMRLPARSSGSASPRQSRTRATSSPPMMIRASEPPMKLRLVAESAILRICAAIKSSLRELGNAIAPITYYIMGYKKDQAAARKISSAQMRAARALLRWTALDLATASKVGVATIRRAEVIDGEIPVTFPNEAALRQALEAAGIVFIEDNGGGEGVRFRKPQRKVREGRR